MQCYSSSSVPFGSSTLVWLATDKWQQQFATIYEISAFERDSFRIEANWEQTRVERLEVGICLVSDLVLVSLCSADCGNWCCNTLITQLMRLLRTSFSINQTSQKRRQLFRRPPVARHVSNSSEILAPNCNIYRTTRKQAVAVLNNPLKIQTSVVQGINFYDKLIKHKFRTLKIEIWPLWERLAGTSKAKAAAILLSWCAWRAAAAALPGPSPGPSPTHVSRTRAYYLHAIISLFSSFLKMFFGFTALFLVGIDFGMLQQPFFSVLKHPVVENGPALD